MAETIINVEQVQPVAAYSPAIVCVEVGHCFAVSPDTIHLLIRHRDVDYCDLSITDARALIEALQAAVAQIEQAKEVK